ncbi:hypothetical protein BCR43DRAFT_486678 [Syncephalastrum racemosum]|uniref:Uncharacterized protein n=1 Tax=Syncephalastrum racemosum TaxID=13706 RepID=A0A1X2HPL7_SYNRA|nr:hypothetical protein BCR43DRAFT_486678 [Syncephalastrum racemosum]
MYLCACYSFWSCNRAPIWLVPVLLTTVKSKRCFFCLALLVLCHCINQRVSPFRSKCIDGFPIVVYMGLLRVFVNAGLVRSNRASRKADSKVRPRIKLDEPLGAELSPSPCFQ